MLFRSPFSELDRFSEKMEVDKEITIFDMAWRWLAAIVTCYRWPKRTRLESSDGSVGLVDFG